MWYVVVFPKEDSVSVVPKSWYVESTNECFWPPNKIKTSDVDKFIKYQYLPQNDWKPHESKLLGKYKTYPEALSKLAKAKNKDTLSSTDNEFVGRGKRKKTITYRKDSTTASDGDESESDHSLTFPKHISKPNPKFSKTEKNLPSFDVETHQEHPSNSSQQKFAKSGRDKVENHSKSSRISGSSCIDAAYQDVLRKSSLSGGYMQKNKRSRSLSPRNVSFGKSLLNSSHSNRDHEQESIIGKHFEDKSVQQILRIVQKIQTDSSEFQIQVIKKLNLLNLKLNDLEDSFNRFQKNNDTIIQSDENNDDKFDNMFPLMNMEKLNDLENILGNDIENKKLIKKLCRVGGTDVSETVKRLMYKMFTNEVGNLFSWNGAKKKQIFKNLKVSNVIFNTVRANKNTADATEADVIIHVKKWLVRCKERMNKSQPKMPNRLSQDDHDSPRAQHASTSDD